LGGLEKLRFYKSPVSNPEFWRRDLILVCRLLIAFLGFLNIDLEFAIELLEVSD
jgi:hypothetical protein